MRQHAFKFKYGQSDIQAQVGEVYDAAGNLISEVQDMFVVDDPGTTVDPEMEPLSVEAPRKQSDFRRFKTWLMDSNQDDEVTRGEMRVFGLGLLSGYVVSKLLR